MKGENERGKTKGDGFLKEYFKIRSDGLLKNGKPKNSFRRAFEEQKFKDSLSGRLLCSEELNKLRFVRSDGLPCSEEQENSKIRSGGLPCSEKWENSKDSDVGFRPSGKEEPRFFGRSGSVSRVGFRKMEESRFISSGGLSRIGKRRTKFGWLLNIEGIKIRFGGLLKNEKELRFDVFLEFSSASVDFFSRTCRSASWNW
ncbi:hypothetical protein RhiirC2_782808 [Rhizophagus irregularis]|uniref:Uncharacterized protein n=1 Tax=Rhizophagus irregularis TaxID=588596 RepID=A0A2N1N2A8_9GLOM|nr:hypothetical protein RhiirC2_782808 [Rhizophagus irregularis]